ncbi:TIGR03086 family metal-binding protein [Serinibacter salmoneus]|uniref:Uncharacterized protein (TIGR03086 family) n=1 Tax=Serinibacter salmoneus TaxID=556530 RepID=A0A2A9D3D6_9MICO|nr:TIGR03086 family metal-binding protein [Serinibacter salmoneus]PFG21217.1 uncharacterized protein (TIGR03086 family) [Serinibacter salmoneus]
MFDLTPVTDELARVVRQVREEDLGAPTPCQEWSVADLLTHIHQFAAVFTANARKEPGHPPADLAAHWREEIPAQLAAMASAWREPAAWEGRVEAGGIEMPAADNALVALEETTVHGWDLARATGQSFAVAPEALDRLPGFFAFFGDAPFGPAVPVPADAPPFDRVLGQTGRDPAWA